MYLYETWFTMQKNLTWYGKVKMGFREMDSLTVRSIEHMPGMFFKKDEGKTSGEGIKNDCGVNMRDKIGSIAVIDF